MKKKGFTLIELLAVIVILAIIALIATPIILNIIGSSKKSAVVRSGELYLSAVETAIARENLNNQFNPTTCIIGNDGNLTCDGDKTIIIEVNGSKPTSGTINLSKGKITTVENMVLDGNELKKEEKGKLTIVGDSTEEPDTPTTPEEPEKPKITYLLKSSKGDETSRFLNGPITRKSVESITITNTKIVPNNVIGSWDASAAKNGNIMAWYTDTDSNGLYELYIGGEGGVTANPTSSYLFGRFVNLKEIDLKYLDTSRVTDMSGMFSLCYNLTSLDVSNFNTSQVTDMRAMFASCTSLTSLDVSNFDTSNVTTMVEMFEQCCKLTSLDVSNFNTSNVTTMAWMFNMGESSGSSGDLTEIIGLENFKTGNVTIMNSMFAGCNNLTTLNLSTFDTSNVTQMNMMFSGCSKLSTLDVSNFDTSKVTNMGWMFSGCRKLTTLDLSSFDTSQVTDMQSMFNSCNSLTSLDLSTFDTINVTDMTSMFSSCSGLITINMKNSIFNNVPYYNYMFSSDTKLTTIYVKDTTAQTFINARLADYSITGVTVTIT